MSLVATVLGTHPTSYWPLTDPVGSTRMHDECGRNEGVPTNADLAEVPFGRARAVHFDGRVGSTVTISDDDKYSHSYANALTVACWISPSSLDFAHTDGQGPQFVHFIEKAVDYTHDAEWAFRLYNATNPERSSRLSFYLFNLGHPVCKGAGAYMEYGRSKNDPVPVRTRRWLFLVGQGEPWKDGTEKENGAILFKQGVAARRSPGDKYNNPPEWNVHPRNGNGVITIGGSRNKTAFCGAIAHVALWNRLINSNEVAQIFAAGQAELAEGC